MQYTVTKTTNTTYKFYHIEKESLTYNEWWIKARAKQRKLNKCGKCKKPFIIGEKMSLAFSHKSLNQVLCNDCADELLEKGDI